MLHPLPVDLMPIEVFQALRGYKEDPGHAAHGAWHAVGFVLNKFDPHTLRAKKLAFPNLDKQIDELEAKTKAVEGMSAAELVAVDWKVILSLAIQILLALLND